MGVIPCGLPFLTLIVLMSLVPDSYKSCGTFNNQTHCTTDFFGAWQHNPLLMAVSALAAILYIACLFRIFAVSIASNGTLLGLVVALFKIVASMFLGLAIVVSVLQRQDVARFC